MKAARVVISFVCALVCWGEPVQADVGEGIRLLRAARDSLDQGDSTAALALLDQAYVELPFAAEEELVYHERADIFAAAGQYVEALDQYGKALHRPAERRARFNSGVLQSRMAEQALQEAGVPLDPAGIPAEADPAPLIAAIEENMPLLEESRRQFMESLRLTPEASGRESVSALTERLDDLAEMLEELRRREEEEQEENEDEEEGDENEDEQDEEENEDEQDEEQEGEDEEQSEDGEEPPEEEQEDSEEDQPPEEQPPQEESAAPAPRPELTSAELADLLEQLEELEAQAMAMDRARREQDQSDVEKDW